MRALGRHMTTSLPALLLLAAACSDEPTSEFPLQYFAVAYGVVSQGGSPVTGIEVNGQVFPAACPSMDGLSVSNGTRSGAGGAYRLLLISYRTEPGQCLRLAAAGAAPVLQTLTETEFTLDEAAVQDSIRIDLEIP
jgi:hypothetical protein